MSGHAHGLAMDTKAPSAFRTISEVATNLEVPQHVLRFWESKFQQVKPMKRGGGRRYYRPEDVTLLSNIKELLYNQGLTIRGVQKLLKETGRGGIVRPSTASASPVAATGVGADFGAWAQRTVASMPATSVAQSAPEVAAIVVKSEAHSLPLSARREMEGVLSDLKAMREHLRQVGV